MDSPVRKMLKRNDYNRHKLLRKIKRRRKAEMELLSKAAEKELKRRMRISPPKYEDGKDDDTSNVRTEAIAEDARQWNENWIETRKDMPMESNDDEYKRQEIEENLKALKKAKLYAVPSNGAWAGQHSHRDPDTGGYSEDPIIELAPEGLNDEIATHEMAHVLGANSTYWRLINQRFKYLRDNVDESANVSRLWKRYYMSPDEIYARRNAFLRSVNADPSHKWTIDEIKNIRDQWNNHSQTNQYTQFSDDDLLWLFNEIAYNPTENTNDVYYADNGKDGLNNIDDWRVNEYGEFEAIRHRRPIIRNTILPSISQTIRDQFDVKKMFLKQLEDYVKSTLMPEGNLLEKYIPRLVPLKHDKGKNATIYPAMTSTDYDDYTAQQLGYTPGSNGHLPSRDYRTGDILKYPSHPTFLKALLEDARLGFYPVKDHKKGRSRTATWKGNSKYNPELNK